MRYSYFKYNKDKPDFEGNDRLLVAEQFDTTDDKKRFVIEASGVLTPEYEDQIKELTQLWKDGESIYFAAYNAGDETLAERELFYFEGLGNILSVESQEDEENNIKTYSLSIDMEHKIGWLRKIFS